MFIQTWNFGTARALDGRANCAYGKLTRESREIGGANVFEKLAATLF